MAWSDALGVVAKLAPTIAAVIGGPLAGGAVTALESVFGLTPSPTASLAQRQEIVAASISAATPELLANIRLADQNYAARMAEAGFKDVETLAALSVQDTTSARDMMVATKSLVPPLLTAMLTIGVFSMFIILAFANIPQDNKILFGSCLGTVLTAWLVSVHFWFGSTQDSARKTELIAQSPAIGS